MALLTNQEVKLVLVWVRSFCRAVFGFPYATGHGFSVREKIANQKFSHLARPSFQFGFAYLLGVELLASEIYIPRTNER